MRKTILTLGLVAALAAPAAALADDPVAAVKAELTKLAADVQSAHGTLLADVGALTTAAQAKDRQRVRSALAKLQSDRQAALAQIQADRQQVKTDLQAVRSAKAGKGSDLKSLLQAARAGDQAALQSLHDAVQQALAALKAARGTHA